MLSRLRTVAENDYEGASLEETLDRLLSEHQAYVMLETHAAVREQEEGRGHN